MESRFNRVKTGLLAATLLSLTASFYLAHLSGRAMSAAVGDTFESLDLETWSALAGMPALVLGVSLIVAGQTGDVPLRAAKLLATSACWFFLQVCACFLIQSLSAP